MGEWCLQFAVAPQFPAQIPLPTASRAQRRGGSVPPELIGRIAPTRTEGINLRGIFRFPVERYVDKILPSVAAEKTTAGSA
jgi:hypothetical protein